MKGKRYTEQRIISILQEREADMKVTDLVRKHGVAEQSIYRWPAKYGGLEISEAKRLKQLEEENRRLKRMQELATRYPRYGYLLSAQVSGR